MDKLERRNVRLDTQPVNFTEFISDLENLSGLLVQPKGLQFTLDLIQPVPSVIMADGTRLRQILWNLIGNGVKFTREGGITVKVWREANDMLCFEVRDSGIGIPKDELEKIFAMYYQVTDSAGGRPATGTGIGLAVSRRLAQAMGGDITVTSEPGKGSCFTLSVCAPAQEAPEEEEDDGLLLPALNILLVEDIELNVVVARSVLEKLGNTVDVAMNGRDALAMFSPEEYDLVLLDIQLPDMSGLDIARELHQRYQADDLPPLVALTANVLKDKKEYLDAGMDEVLSKPLAVGALTQMIAKFWGDGSEALPAEESGSAASEDVYAQSLDLEMLNQYIELVGPKLIEDSLDVFEKMMPGYLAILNSNMVAKDRKGIAEEGHKIKGAAGSVGLIHLRQVAQQIQSPELPAWDDNVQEWVDELNHDWESQVGILRNWLANRR